MKGKAVAWALVATSLPMFMVAVDNLVVTNALAVIARDLDTGPAGLQWVMSGYILAFAGLLLAGAALGDRIGRRRVFVGGTALFTVASAACALAGSPGVLIAARAVQGVGGAAILPVSLTLAVAAAGAERRALAVGVWGGVNGLGIAAGPLVGGLVTEGLDWHWIFWINVPVGLVAVPLALWAIGESTGERRRLDVPGTVLVTAAVVAAVWGIVRFAEGGLAALGGGLAVSAALLAGFGAWQRRTPDPLVPPHLYRVRPFMLSNVLALAMYFGVFGSIFFLAQFLQTTMGYSPFEAGLRTLPWTAAPMVAVPVASALVDRIGGGILQAAGCLLQSGALVWLALTARPGVSYGAMAAAMVVAGTGMGLVFAANPSTVIGSVAEPEHNLASGVNNTIREFGGALGIAVLTAVYVHGGLRSAVLTGAAVVFAGAFAGFAMGRGTARPGSGPAPSGRHSARSAPPAPSRLP
ncbi:EmrB/QacA subfamily drug resistance transporter [Streptomyces griseochromogenes]|uniref:EmrB/QacA subfamily drug resistance transporter n=1 Tax=Streptomyces griseochromogenes TaxID=68214 RepID=A0A1B1ANY6_9ACTN|nr:MFS transporter [Streptomyces griseochromogenes]ANP48287.1 MFS transporter [Streptomyces griseochromogenes]MBP2050777.1 EmrB/QacA subfamily drug resistance transporter [Streptomyces griseochromogenes]